jgi:hypothetical protein
MIEAHWPWLALAGLGIFHGLNPAMGWLFAVALGFQEGNRAAVLRALPPIALGHEASIALVVILVSGAQLVTASELIQPLGAVTASELIRPVGAVALIAFGVYKLVRRRHPRWVGMRVSGKDLVVWSFLMSSAHGAGLMLFPVLLGLPAPVHVEPVTVGVQDTAAVLLHTAAMLVAMAVVAVVVYDRIGVLILRRAWVNLDLVWAVVVIAAGLATLFT